MSEAAVGITGATASVARRAAPSSTRAATSAGSARARSSEQRLSRRGRVATFTKDHLVPSPDPPTVMVAADLEGGGRFYTQLTDGDLDPVTFDLPSS